MTLLEIFANYLFRLYLFCPDQNFLQLLCKYGIGWSLQADVAVALAKFAKKQYQEHQNDLNLDNFGPGIFFSSKDRIEILKVVCNQQFEENFLVKTLKTFSC